MNNTSSSIVSIVGMLQNDADKFRTLAAKTQAILDNIVKASLEFMDAQMYLDDFLDDYPCVEAYDDEQIKEYQERVNEKWRTHDNLKELLNKTKKN